MPESVKSELSLGLNEKLKGDYLFNDIEKLYKKLFIEKEKNDLKKNEYSHKISKKPFKTIIILTPQSRLVNKLRTLLSSKLEN